MEDDDSAAVQGEMPIFSDLRASLVEHHMPIMSLGSGRTTLQDKYCAVMYAMMLEAGPTPDCLASFANEIIAGTSDLGVEFSLSKILPTFFRNLFPWFHMPDAAASGGDDSNCRTDDDDDGFDVLPEPEHQPGDVENISFQNMVSVPGPLHIIDNLQSVCWISCRT